MEISLPDVVQFWIYDKDEHSRTGRRDLCFRHAVIRAVRGEEIHHQLAEYDYDCGDCKEAKDA